MQTVSVGNCIYLKIFTLRIKTIFYAKCCLVKLFFGNHLNESLILDILQNQIYAFFPEFRSWQEYIPDILLVPGHSWGLNT